MSEPFSPNDIKALLRDKIIGLGERSTQKSYYAQLRQKLQEAEQARQKLAESEARYRRIVNTANEGIWVLTADWRTAFVNAKMAELLGLAPEEMLGRPITDFIFAEDAADHAERMERRRKGLSEQYERRFRRRDGETVWTLVSGTPMFDADEGFIGAFAMYTDITDRKRREEHIKLLLRELNHRAKNMLMLVQAIAQQTAASEPGEFVLRFCDRIHALAASQDLLVHNEWRGVALEDLVRSQLACFADLIGSRIVLTGPSLRLSASSAQAVGMALHELVTNASKYGALSNSAGKVKISWRTEDHYGADDHFVLTWVEREGPPVQPPRRRGFGHNVLVSMLKLQLEGSVELDYLREGLRWTLACPTQRVFEP